MDDPAGRRNAEQPPPLFTKREKRVIAALTLSFIVLSAIVHVVIGSVGSTLFPHMRPEAAAPPHVFSLYRLETPTPTPIPVPTPTPRTTSTPRPSAQRTSAPDNRTPVIPRAHSSSTPAVAASLPPHVLGPPVLPAPSPVFSTQPTATPSASSTPVVAVDADFVRKGVPEYPELALEQHVEGQVTVRVTIGPDGRVEEASLALSSGSKLLDDAALDAARTSTFKPPLVNGVPTTRDYLIVYTFSLED